MQEKEFEEDQFKTDPQVLGAGEDNRDLRDNPVGDADRDRNEDPTALYLTSDSTLQSPAEHEKDQKKNPLKEPDTFSDTRALDETGEYDDKGEAAS